MFDLLFRLPDIYLFALLCCSSVIFSILAVFLVKRFIPLELRYRDNPVIGNVGAIISLIYGVLAGLTALYLINNISYTADAVQHEANAAANIYRASQLLREPVKTEIKNELKKYLTAVINVEWPAMKNGETIKNDANTNINKMSRQLLSEYTIANNADSLIVRDIVDSVKMLYDARQQRIQMSYSEISCEIWIVILIGTILTIVINYFYGMNFYLHLLSVCFVTLMSVSMIFLLITLDRPFQGEFVIESDSFQAILASME